MYSCNRSSYDKWEWSNEQTCNACGVTFYCNRYYDVPRHCSQGCLWYSERIKAERLSKQNKLTIKQFTKDFIGFILIIALWFIILFIANI